MRIRLSGAAPAVGAALAVGAVLAACAASAPPSAAPPTLVLGELTGAIAKAAGSDVAPGYRFPTAFPSTPTSAQVWRVPGTALDTDTVVRLARALHLEPAVREHAHGWVVSSSAGELRVRADTGEWVYTRADRLSCPPRMLDVDQADPLEGTVGCAVASPVTPGATPPPPTPAPADATARELATPVIDVVRTLGGGILAGTPVVERYDDLAAVRFRPTVDGWPTLGLDTTVDVDARGIRDAAGWLAAPTAGARYPLRSAAQAARDLSTLPQPAIACPLVGAPEPMPPGPCRTEPPTITAVRLGLLLAWDQSGSLPRPILVPAWFFATDASSEPIPIVAVDPRYLGEKTAAGSPAPSGSAVPPVPPSPTGAPDDAPPQPASSDGSPQPAPSEGTSRADTAPTK